MPHHFSFAIPFNFCFTFFHFEFDFRIHFTQSTVGVGEMGEPASIFPFPFFNSSIPLIMRGWKKSKQGNGSFNALPLTKKEMPREFEGEVSLSNSFTEAQNWRKEVWKLNLRRTKRCCKSIVYIFHFSTERYLHSPLSLS